MRKITQMVGRERVWYLQTNSDRNSELCLEIRGQQVVVRLPFHSSTRIRLKNMGQIKDTKKNTLGMRRTNNKEQIRALKTSTSIYISIVVLMIREVGYKL